MRKFSLVLTLTILLCLLTSCLGYSDSSADYEEGYNDGYAEGYYDAYNDGYDDGFEHGYDAGHEEDYDAILFDGIDYAHQDLFTRLYNSTASTGSHFIIFDGQEICTPDFSVVFTYKIVDGTVHITCDLTLKSQTINDAYIDELFFFFSYTNDLNGNREKILYDTIFFDYAALESTEEWEDFCKSQNATATFDTYLSLKEWSALDSIIACNGNIYLITLQNNT